MKTILIILGYLKWHYGKAICSLSAIWINFLRFVYQFFSVELSFKNFLDPWKRMSDSYPNSFDLKKYFYAFINNLIMRVLGMTLRSIIIIVGLMCCTLLLIMYPIILIIWLVLPFIIITLIITGILLIIK